MPLRLSTHDLSANFDDPAYRAHLPEALALCRSNRRHGVARMTGHRFPVAGDADIQETVFASGLRVLVNFGDTPATVDGRSVPARGRHVDG
jgi:hypothetical protein